MKCYTYRSGQLDDGVVIAGTNQKTCAINLNIPQDWNIDAVIHCIRNRTDADILMYGCTELVEGNSLSSVFPQDCVLIRCMDIIHTHNFNNACLELNLTKDSIDYILFDGCSIYSDTETVYITNVNGELTISKNPYSPESGILGRVSKDYEISL